MSQTKTYTPLRPDNSALIMIDHQVKFMLACQTPDQLKSNSIALAKICAIFTLPTITTGGYPSDPLLPEVVGALKDPVHVSRKTINCWETPEFVKAVKATGRCKLIMAGITTDLCLMFPALAAVSEGYEVYAVLDASGCWSNKVEEMAIRRLVMGGVQPMNWMALAGELQGKAWNEDKGPQIMSVFAEHSGQFALINAMHG